MPTDQQQTVRDAVGPKTKFMANRALRQLRRIAGYLHREFGDVDREGTPIRMIGEEYRVKTAESLARKFVDEADDVSPDSLDEFVKSANDLIRFSMEVPEDMYNGDVVLSALRRLGDLGFKTANGDDLANAVDAKNFWRKGNRFYGLNVTVREPTTKHLMELQFVTKRSWDAGKLTHLYFEVVRRPENSFDQRVDSFLQILRINKAAGLPDHIPDLNDIPEAKYKAFSDWLSKDVDAGLWRPYVEELARHDIMFEDLVRQHGLDPDADLPGAREAGLYNHVDVQPTPEAERGPLFGGHEDPSTLGDLNRLFHRSPGEDEPFGEYHDGLDFRTISSPLREGMPRDPNEAYARLSHQVAHLESQQAARSEALRGDPKRWFAQVYKNVTHFERMRIERGRYTYPIMKLQEVVAFDRTFELNLDHWQQGHIDQVEPNWQLAFRAIERAPEKFHLLHSFEVMGALLPAMVAHIELDLPRALAAVFEEYYQANGIPFDTFRPDFDSMQIVFDLASAALMPDIVDVTQRFDPGRFEFIQRIGFPFIYDVARARQEAWLTAGLIVSGHELGIHDAAGLELRVTADRRSVHPLTGNGGMRIDGHKVRGYDFGAQPMDTLRHPPVMDGRDRIIVQSDGRITTGDAQAAVSDRIGPHRPELASVVEKLLDDPHGLNVTASLRMGDRHEYVMSIMEELARGDALRPYGGDLAAFLAENHGHGPLFEHVPPEFNKTIGPDGVEVTRLNAFVDERKAADPTMRIGANPSPEQVAAVEEHADELRDFVQPAVHREIETIAELLRGHTTGPVDVNSRPKDAAGLFDKVNRMAQGRENSPGRPWYRIGDVIDAVGARLTVPDMRTLERAYAAVMDHFGVGDGGRIIEIDNMYADPKTKNLTYRVIPMVITIDVGGHRYPFELQLTSLRASVAADIEHNSLYKRYVDISPDEEDAVAQAFDEAAALDQREARDE